MTIQQQIDALKKEFENKIAELEKQLAEKQKPSKEWKPKKGEGFYFVGFDGEIFCEQWEGDEVDEELYTRGNFFKTREEAEWENQHRIVATELKHFVAENDPRPITEEDWGNMDIRKWFLFYDHKYKVFEMAANTYTKYANQVYASSKEVLEKAIEHIGEERLKKYYFGVKE